MNFVAVKHANNNKYLFRVPEGVTLDAGTAVLCDTSRGTNQPGVCVTATFEADPAVICPLWGTEQKNLRRVTTVLREFKLEWPEGTETTDETDWDEDDDIPV